MLFRYTLKPGGRETFSINGKRVSNHDFSVAWLAALDVGRITHTPTRTLLGVTEIWEG